MIAGANREYLVFWPAFEALAGERPDDPMLADLLAAARARLSGLAGQGGADSSGVRGDRRAPLRPADVADLGVPTSPRSPRGRP